jgi:hypothetical protein
MTEPAEVEGCSGWAIDAEGRLVDTGQPMEVIAYGPPPPARWVSPDDLGSVFGLRCALAGRDRTTYDLRAASEVFESNGGRYLNVVLEAQWYRWRELTEEYRPAGIPRATCVATRHVWIEHLDPNPCQQEGEVST